MQQCILREVTGQAVNSEHVQVQISRILHDSGNSIPMGFRSFFFGSLRVHWIIMFAWLFIYWVPREEQPKYP